MAPKRKPKPHRITRKNKPEARAPRPPTKKIINDNSNGNGRRNLTPKQLRFVQERIKDPAATDKEIAIRAGYSEATAGSQATALLKDPRISSLVADSVERAGYLAEVDGARVMREDCCIAFYDIADLFAAGSFVPLAPSQLPEDIRRAIASVQVKVRTIPTGKDQPPIQEVEYAYKLLDKGAALDRMGRRLGLYEKDNVQRKPPPNVNIILEGDNQQTIIAVGN